MESEQKTETLIKGGNECPAHEVESREMCDAALPSYFLLKVTTANYSWQSFTRVSDP